MDQAGLDPARHRAALAGLARINRASRSARVLWPPVADLARRLGRPVRLLDIACGGGDVLFDLEAIARRAGVVLAIHGIDVSDTALSVARESARLRDSAASFSRGDVRTDPLPGGHDAVTCSLFLHHLTESDAILVLRRMAEAAGQLVVVNDLNRSRVGWWIARTMTRLLTTNDVVHVDGPRSVEGAFTPEEAADLAARAGLVGAVVARRWPWRFLLTWSKGGAA